MQIIANQKEEIADVENQHQYQTRRTRSKTIRINKRNTIKKGSHSTEKKCGYFGNWNRVANATLFQLPVCLKSVYFLNVFLSVCFVLMAGWTPYLKI